MEKEWRLIVDGKGNGYYNMAVDEALLNCYQRTHIPVLRLYSWDTSFISLGYNQLVEQALLSYDLPFVRRITGGAGILHGNELTYSIVCSAGDLNLPKKIKESYAVICSFLKLFYAKLGFSAVFAKDSIAQEVGQYEHFCFSTCEPFDLLIGGKKIGGNAQRRRKGVIFQHGSIPITIDFGLVRAIFQNTDNISTKATCLVELLKDNNDFFALRDSLAESFRKTFGINLFECVLSKEEETTVQYLLENKYCNKEWNYKRIYHEETGLAQ